MQEKMNIKMIATDLDGTLLRTDKTVSDYTRDVFKRCRERGAHIAFATARYFLTVEKWLSPQIGIVPDVTISLNGACAYTLPEREILYNAVIEPEIANALIQEIRGYINRAGTDRGWYCKPPIPSTHPFSIKCDFSSDINERFHFIDCVYDKTLCDEILDKYPSVRYQKYSNTDSVTLLHTHAKKHLALSVVIEKLGIKPEETVVFGDDYNDIEMLSIPGIISVAAENALDEVKALSDYICDSNDNDGVAKWLEENVL
jgi:Cof subfamily protein (haloacid dehalogenase superfamily)